MSEAIRCFYLRALRVLFFSDFHATRFTLGISELLWAITLLWPGETFDNPMYRGMAGVMPENAWGVIFLATGILQLTILTRGDYHSKGATCFAAWNMVLRFYVVISMYLSVSPPPAEVSGEAALALAAMWVWVRSGFPVQGRRAADFDRRGTRCGC